MSEAKSRTRDRAYWLARANELPTETGVYLMKDADGAVIYVGKAKSLKARVRSYFQEGTSDYRAFIGILSGVLADIETIVARSEKEALLLERELIRRHEPRFNIIWRDDKQFLCLRIDTAHEFPQVEVVRQLGKDGARYFGPFHSATSARQTLRVINRHFQLRTCSDSVLYNRRRPCIEYQIGRCPAPCVFEVDRDKYKENVEDVVLFLEGKGKELVDRLEARMWAAAERTDYEVAAHYRDQRSAVQKTLEKQQIALSSLLDQDVYGLYREGAEVSVAALEIRNGRVQNVITSLVEHHGAGDAEALESFLIDRYRLGADLDGPRPAQEVLVPIELEGEAALAELLSERKKGKVAIKVPRRGDRAGLLEMAKKNAEHAFHERRRMNGALDDTLQALKARLRLKNHPLNIECYDISNLGGQLIVGSKVVFNRALPYKAGYRHYRVKSTKGQDDFASLYEVLSRRLKKGQAGGDLPDLIVIDGGKGQLNVARAAMKDLGIEDVDLISLAKSRVTGTDLEDGSVRSPERVFTPGAKEPIVLKQDSPENLLLARLRDEAHRFAITFHKSLRNKARLRSALEDIPGIGRTRKQALLRELGSLRRVREASIEELARVPGVGPAAARRVWSFFRASENPLAVPMPSADHAKEATHDIADDRGASRESATGPIHENEDRSDDFEHLSSEKVDLPKESA